MDSLLGEFRAALRSASRAFIYRVPGECECCPSCGSPRLYELDLLSFRGRRVDGVRTGFVSGCEGCGLVFSNPQPTPEELRRFYSPTGEWGSRRVSAGNTREPGARVRGRTGTRIFGPIREFVTTPLPGAKVLDFGCGDGELLDSLQECGWDTWGVETAVDEAFPRHHRIDAVPDTPMFDLIVAKHVLEHVTDPLGLLRQFARASRIGGYLLVGVPRLDTLPIHRDYKYVINGRAHVTAYTWPCLQGLLARSGWKPVAPPPDRVSKGRGRQTSARLRVVAQRVKEHLEPAPSPAAAARGAVRRYHADIEGRSLLGRLGWHRLAARSAEARRRHAIGIRKSAKRAVGA